MRRCRWRTRAGSGGCGGGGEKVELTVEGAGLEEVVLVEVVA